MSISFYFLHLIHFKKRPFKWVNAAAGISFQKAFVVTSDDAVALGAQSQLHHHLSVSQSQSWAVASEGIHPTEAVACLYINRSWQENESFCS